MAKQAEKERGLVAAAKARLKKQEKEAQELAEAELIVADDDARIAEEARLAKRAELVDEFDRRAAVVVEKRDAAIEKMIEYAQLARTAYQARRHQDSLLPTILHYSVAGEDLPVRPAKVAQLFANVGGGEEGAAIQADLKRRGISINDARLAF